VQLFGVDVAAGTGNDSSPAAIASTTWQGGVGTVGSGTGAAPAYCGIASDLGGLSAFHTSEALLRRRSTHVLLFLAVYTPTVSGRYDVHVTSAATGQYLALSPYRTHVPPGT